MIPASEVFGILAATCLLPPLYRGAVQDLKEFKFSEEHFNNLFVRGSIFNTIVMYVLLIFHESGWLFAAELLAISVVASVFFSFVGFRYGGGGDWRALIYIAWIAPFLLIYTILAMMVCGALQAFYWIARPDIDVPPAFRKVPFAVSIFAGYAIALVFFVLTA